MNRREEFLVKLKERLFPLLDEFHDNHSSVLSAREHILNTIMVTIDDEVEWTESPVNNLDSCEKCGSSIDKIQICSGCGHQYCEKCGSKTDRLCSTCNNEVNALIETGR